MPTTPAAVPPPTVPRTAAADSRSPATDRATPPVVRPTYGADGDTGANEVIPVPVTPPPTPTPAAGNGAANAPAAGDSFSFEQFPAAEGVYVLNTRTGSVQTVTGQGQVYSFPFAGLETVRAATLNVPGRFRGSLVQNTLYVLDRQSGVLEKVQLSNLTRTVVLAAGATPAAGAAGAGFTPTSTAGPAAGQAQPVGAGELQGGGATTTEGHLPPPPTYATVQVPAQVTAADRQKAEREIDDYGSFLAYPYIGAPVGDGYQLQVRICNRGTRALAALEVTVEYTDPKDQTLVQQRYYFRRDNGETNAPPGPGLERTMTLQLPTFKDQPTFKITTSYLVLAD